MMMMNKKWKYRDNLTITQGSFLIFYFSQSERRVFESLRKLKECLNLNANLPPFTMKKLNKNCIFYLWKRRNLFWKMLSSLYFRNINALSSPTFVFHYFRYSSFPLVLSLFFLLFPSPWDLNICLRNCTKM